MSEAHGPRTERILDGLAIDSRAAIFSSMATLFSAAPKRAALMFRQASSSKRRRRRRRRRNQRNELLQQLASLSASSGKLAASPKASLSPLFFRVVVFFSRRQFSPIYWILDGSKRSTKKIQKTKQNEKDLWQLMARPTQVFPALPALPRRLESAKFPLPFVCTARVYISKTILSADRLPLNSTYD